MNRIKYRRGSYQTATPYRVGHVGWFPSLYFYLMFYTIVFFGGMKAKRGCYNDADWCRGSLGIMRALERVGVRFDIQGIEHVRKTKGPCVFVANHMSMLETLVLPIVIQPEKDVTFVVKRSLSKIPFFKYILRSRKPIAVDRVNPREDFKTIMREGMEKLRSGRSLIIFPQAGRTDGFDPAGFNSIGVKLAAQADVPVIPIALMTNAWKTGRYFRDWGGIDPEHTVHFAFGPQLKVQKNGKREHEMIIAFIRRNLETWTT